MVRRVHEHAWGQGLEEKFLPYLEGADIYFHECCNEVEMSALERLLINQYKPILNVVDVVPGDATVIIELDWKYYLDSDFITPSTTERDIMMCQKNITSNNTRIQTYCQERDALQNRMTALLPFYDYLGTHYAEFARNPDGYYGLVTSEVPVGDTVYIGSQEVEKWYDTISYSNGYTWVQFSGELLQALFAIAHQPHWIDDTMNYVGKNHCQLISKKVANLRRRNCELKAKIEALQEKRHEAIF
jgi:hypothetical protein